MSKHVANSMRIYVGPYDLTTAHTNLKLELKRDPADANCMLADSEGTEQFWQTWLHGMRSFMASHSGYSEAGAGAVNTVLNGYFGADNSLITMCAPTGAVGENAYSMQALVHEHKEIDGTIGGMNGYAGAASGQGTPIVRGTIFGTGEKTVTGNSAIYQLGAITSGTNKLYAALHVTDSSGDDTQAMTIKLYSAPTGAFSSPTERVAFTAVGNGITSELKSLATTVTDTYWRATWTISGGGAEVGFTFLLNAGIITL